MPASEGTEQAPRILSARPLSWGSSGIAIEYWPHLPIASEGEHAASRARGDLRRAIEQQRHARRVLIHVRRAADQQRDAFRERHRAQLLALAFFESHHRAQRRPLVVDFALVQVAGERQWRDREAMLAGDERVQVIAEHGQARCQSEARDGRLAGARASGEEVTVDGGAVHEQTAGREQARGEQRAEHVFDDADRFGRLFDARPDPGAAEVEEVLRDMSSHSEPLVRELPRRPGQKEERWAHTTGGAIVETAPDVSEAHEVRGEPLTVRVQRLEEQVATLTSALNELKTKLGE